MSRPVIYTPAEARARHAAGMRAYRATAQGKAACEAAKAKYEQTPAGKRMLKEKERTQFRCLDCREPADLARTLSEGRKIGPYKWLCPECDL